MSRLFFLSISILYWNLLLIRREIWQIAVGRSPHLEIWSNPWYKIVRTIELICFFILFFLICIFIRLFLNGGLLPLSPLPGYLFLYVAWFRDHGSTPSKRRIIVGV